MATRPPTLVAAVVPVAVGAACAEAEGGLRLPPTLLAVGTALLIQVGTNFANDVFDFEKGADTAERLGPTRAVQAGLLDPAAVRRGMVVAFAGALAFGVGLCAVSGWPLLALGIVSILAGLAYTAGPYPLGYHGLGDVFVLAFFGFAAVAGTAWANLLRVPELAWWAAVPPGALATGILVVNNLRDRPTDERAGKRTLAVRLGRRGAVAEYALLVLAAYAVPIFLAVREGAPWLLLPVATLPLAVVLLVQVGTREGRPLNATLFGTARLLVLHGGLFAIGIAAGG